MTGNTTDLGIGIVRALLLQKDSVRYQDEIRAVSLRAGIITTFALGSAVGAVLFIHFQYLGFLLPASIALYTLIWETYVSTVIFIRKSPHQISELDPTKFKPSPLL